LYAKEQLLFKSGHLFFNKTRKGFTVKALNNGMAVGAIH
jgi:hypothetical protein